MIIDCKTVATKWKEECKGTKATLAIVQIGDNPASNSYIKGKIKDCEEVGFNTKLLKYPEGVSEAFVLDVIHLLNEEETVDGIIVQLPLPQHINAQKIANAIVPEKDVDGFLVQSPFTQCTPLGIINLIKEINVDLNGKMVVVLGRSENVGKKAAELCLNENATICVCHSKTPKEMRDELLKRADVVISAVGKANLFTYENVKEGAIVIDVGINRNNEGKLCGDFTPSGNPNYCDYTPVPGGIGLLTRAMLLKNTKEAHLLRKKI
jgi:methylenetetrahydrofolate dehydrogenase (NADP+)/methenyltetrahydrofolate cyclohydrolase